MIDLKINNDGDIITGSDESPATILLRWKITDAPTIRLLFKTGTNHREFKPGADALSEPVKLMFDTEVADKQKIIVTCTDEEELQQKILILTRATPRIVIQKHEDITSDKVLGEIQAAVLEQINGLLDDPSVIIRKNHYDGIFSWQNLSVYIYDGKKEIYNFELEV